MEADGVRPPATIDLPPSTAGRDPSTADSSVHAVALTEAPQSPTTEGAAPAAEAHIGAANPVRDGLLIFAAAGAVCVVGYLVAAVPGNWFPAAPTKSWAASELGVARGVSGLEDGELVVTGVDAAGTAPLVVVAFPNARAALADQTSVNRITLQFAPLAVVFVALAFRAFAERLSAPRTVSGPSMAEPDSNPSHADAA